MGLSLIEATILTAIVFFPIPPEVGVWEIVFDSLFLGSLFLTVWGAAYCRLSPGRKTVFRYLTAVPNSIAAAFLVHVTRTLLAEVLPVCYSSTWVGGAPFGENVVYLALFSTRTLAWRILSVAVCSTSVFVLLEKRPPAPTANPIRMRTVVSAGAILLALLWCAEVIAGIRYGRQMAIVTTGASPQVIRTLRTSRFAGVREAAIFRLANTRGAPDGEFRVGVRAIEECLDDRSAHVREAALRALERLAAVKETRVALSYGRYATALTENPHPAVREGVGRILGMLADRRAVRMLLAALSSADPHTRNAAIGALGTIGDRTAIPFLLKRLNSDPPAEEKTNLIVALGKLGHAGVTGMLIDLLRDQDSSSLVAAPFQGIGGPAVEPLMRAFGDPAFEKHRSTILYLLGEMGDERAIPLFLHAVRDSRIEVRCHAIEGLRKFRDPRAVTVLTKTLKDPDAGVRANAIYALATFRDPRTIRLLGASLKDAAASVRISAAKALLAFGDDTVLRHVEPLLHTWPEGTARRLVQIGGPAVAPLCEALGAGNGRTLSCHAAAALGAIGNPAAVKRLLRMAHDPDRGMRECAVRALGKSGDRRAAGALMNALQDPYSGVRWAAADALGRLGDARALPSLTRALSDANWMVRERAERAIGTLTTKQ